MDPRRICDEVCPSDVDRKENIEGVLLVEVEGTDHRETARTWD